MNNKNVTLEFAERQIRKLSSLNKMCWDLMVAGIRHRRPDISDEELRNEIKFRLELGRRGKWKR